MAESEEMFERSRRARSKHELPIWPGVVPPDDASCASKSQASIDLSELFNPSALTRLLRQLNDQIDGQRDQIVFLEEQSIANAAFREMWAQDRAEFRAALAVATEENNKKINEAIGAAAHPSPT
ncbi:hypothetical protein JL720_6808 [Aureococcus anophagefferens]|nr:hypothetical protein JL720_6808 [Aureococcus anophagefferens]